MLSVASDPTSLLLQQAFLNDVSASNLSLTGYFSKEEDLRAGLDAIKKNYSAFIVLYHDLLSESPEEYPRISQKLLLEFIAESNLLPKNRVASETKNAPVARTAAE